MMQQFLETDIPTKAKIIVDMREDELFVELLKSCGAIAERKTLDVGDFLCSARLIVERKTRADFEQSIIDGRLFSQLQNLTSNYERSLIVVEGETAEGRLDSRAVLGAYASVIADYGAALFFTRNKEKTAELVFSLAKHEQLAKKQPLRIFAKRKTHNISQIQRAVVETFPMVGPKLAKNILSHFGGIEAFFNASEKELLEVDGMGKKRAKTIRNAIQYSYNNEEDS